MSNLLQTSMKINDGRYIINAKQSQAVNSTPDRFVLFNVFLLISVLVKYNQHERLKREAD